MASGNAPIQAARNAFTIVEKLVELDGCTVTDLAKALDMPKSTVFDYLRTLSEEGYLVNDDGTYSVSTRLLSISSRNRRNNAIYTVARSEVGALSSRLNEHASLMIEEGGYGVILYTSPAEHTETILASVGMRTYLHATAPGKAILANLAEARCEDILDAEELPAVTENTLTDPAAVREELETVRERGYATDAEEGINGVLGVSAPVMNRNDGSVKGAISVYGPGSRDDIESFVDEVQEPLVRTSNIVEVNITYPEPSQAGV